MANHYFFKFRPQNAGIKAYEELEDRFLKKGDIIPLPIYFYDWTVKDYQEYINPNKEEKNSDIKANFSQIKTFFDIGEKCTEKEDYFWIFYDGRIFCLKPISNVLNITNNDENTKIKIKVRNKEEICDIKTLKYKARKGFSREVLKKICNYHDLENEATLKDIKKKQKEGSYKQDVPKVIFSEVISAYDASDIPDFFSETGGNQSYNRLTISELKENLKEFAEKLVLKEGSSIKLDEKNFLSFLSPAQLETLVALFFINDENDIFFRSLSGKTMPDFDVHIKNLDEKTYEKVMGERGSEEKLGSYPKNLSFQIKLKNLDEEEEIVKKWQERKKKEEKGTARMPETYLVHIGSYEKKEKGILYFQWIIENIKKRDDIKQWLKEIVFDNPVFDKSNLFSE